MTPDSSISLLMPNFESKSTKNTKTPTNRRDWGEMKQGQVETVTIIFMGDNA